MHALIIRLIALALGGLAVLGMLAWAGWWAIAGWLADRRIAEIVDQEFRAGGRIAWVEQSKAGFPFTIERRFTNLAWQRFRGEGLISDELRLTISPLSPSRIRFETRGETRILTPPLAGRLRVHFAGAEITGNLVTGGPYGLRDFRLAMRDARPGLAPARSMIGAVQPVRLARAAGLRASLAFADTPPDTSLPPLATLTMEWLGVALPENGLIPAAGEPAERLVFEASLSGPDTGFASTGAMRAWRDNGGSLTISDITIERGEFQATGAGEFILDHALQPAGTLTLRAAGVNALVNDAVTAGLLRREAAGLLQAGLAMMAAAANERDARGRPLVRLPVSLEQSLWRAGPVPVGTMPVIDWDTVLDPPVMPGLE